MKVNVFKRFLSYIFLSFYLLTDQLQKHGFLSFLNPQIFANFTHSFHEKSQTFQVKKICKTNHLQ
jgi:hypothetical protein